MPGPRRGPDRTVTVPVLPRPGRNDQGKGFPIEAKTGAVTGIPVHTVTPAPTQDRVLAQRADPRLAALVCAAPRRWS